MTVRFAANLAALIAVLCPPLGVFLMDGCSCNLLLNLILTSLFYLPGLVHAWCVIFNVAALEEEINNAGIGAQPIAVVVVQERH